MQLEDFFDYKNQLMEDILTNETIVKLIDDESMYDDPAELMYTQVFPYEYIPETVDDGWTYICCDVDAQSVGSKTFLMPIIYIWVFSHRSRLRIKEGGLRIDKLCSEICKQINGSRFYTLGELRLNGVRRFAPSVEYSGKVLTFIGKEFNTQYDGRKPTPVNRKG